MVTASFPQVTPEEHHEILKRLLEEMWNKNIDFEAAETSTWWASFTENVTRDAAIQAAITDFQSCSKPYCKPRLAIHWGPDKPVFIQ